MRLVLCSDGLRRKEIADNATGTTSTSATSSTIPSTTSPASATAHHSSLGTGAIAGIAAGVAFIAALSLAYLIYRRIVARRLHSGPRPFIDDEHPTGSEPMNSPPPLSSSSRTLRTPLMSEAGRASMYDVNQSTHDLVADPFMALSPSSSGELQNRPGRSESNRSDYLSSRKSIHKPPITSSGPDQIELESFAPPPVYSP